MQDTERDIHDKLEEKSDDIKANENELSTIENDTEDKRSTQNIHVERDSVSEDIENDNLKDNSDINWSITQNKAVENELPTSGDGVDGK